MPGVDAASNGDVGEHAAEVEDDCLDGQRIPLEATSGETLPGGPEGSVSGQLAGLEQVVEAGLVEDGHAELARPW